MPAVAIVAGNSDYSQLPTLPCCRMDVEAVSALLEATGRFDAIHPLVNLTADNLKHRLREIFENKGKDEIFFYYSGHGYFHGDEEFYFCTCDFNPLRPNQTGLSNKALTDLLRDASPELAVKVIDACNSGALMIKAERLSLPDEKGGLKSLVQIASCLDSQTSLAGDPLSEFTEAFCRAAARKTEGSVYYTDLIEILRDEYITNQDRSPHFVTQFNGRQLFLEDATRLSAFRNQLAAKWTRKPVTDTTPTADIAILPPTAPRSLASLLAETDSKLGRLEDVSAFVDALFNGLKEKLDNGELSEFFEFTTVEHTDLVEKTTRGFIIRVLSQEQRQDDFVTVRKNMEAGPLAGIMALYRDPDDSKHWHLTLNMRMDRVQMRITLTPKFSTLQRIVLVVTCAPSLAHCYVFELATRHPRTDWGTFAAEGTEVIRSWYKMGWREDVGGLVNKIAERLKLSLNEYLAAVAERLTKGDKQ